MADVHAPRCWRLRLMGEFAAERDGHRVDTPPTASRVLACLAVHGQVLGRQELAGQLWPRLSTTRAAGSLRTALWRVRQLGIDAVEPRRDWIALAPTVSVDLDELIRDVHSCLVGAVDSTGLSERLGVDLLPDWTDDWLIAPRERIRSLRIEALESLCAALTRRGRRGEAIDVALSAVSADPLREQPRRLLIAAHLAEGNRAEALRAFKAYRQLTLAELGHEPSPTLASLARLRQPGW